MPSTVIRRFAYQPEEQALDIEFVTGRVYRYRGVPENVAAAMKAAFSKGSYFNRAIRDRYEHRRLRGWPGDAPSQLHVR